MASYTAPVVVAAGEELYDNIDIQNATPMAADAVVVRIAGLVLKSGAGGTAIVAHGGYATQQVVIEATGVVRAHGIGHGVSTHVAQIRNFGTIDAFGSTYAMGMGSTSTAQHLNAGTINVRGPVSATAVSINVGGGADFINQGSVTVRGSGSSIGVSLIGQSVSFTNGGVGVIQAIDTSETGTTFDSIGLSIRANSLKAGGEGLHNAGVIQGDVAVFFDRFDASADSLALSARTFNNDETGILRGKVVGSASGEAIVNRGLIEGEIGLNAGNDLYDGSGSGRVTGMVQGGDGADTLMGGAQFDYLHGNKGDDSNVGGAGDDWVVGGQGNDRLYGDDGLDIAWGNLGNDTCYGGAGQDQVRGGQGDDFVHGGDGVDFVSGDRGDDTVYGGAGADIFHSFAEAGIDRIMDFNQTEGDVLNLLGGSTYTVAQVGADVVVSVTGGAQVTLVGVQLAALSTGWLTVG